MQLRELLKKIIDWFLHQSHQTTEALILEEFTVTGIRALKLNRKSHRAIVTWKILFYERQYDLCINCDTLAAIEGVKSIERSNKLSTHLLNVFVIHYNLVLDPISGKRKIRKDVLLSEEICLQAAYSTRTYTQTILNEFAKLFLKQPKYDPYRLDMRDTFEKVAQHYLGKSHQVFTSGESWLTGMNSPIE